MAALGLALPAASSAVELTGTNLTLVITVAAIAVIALVMGFVFRGQVLAADTGTENMRTIGAAVEEGAQAFLALGGHPQARDQGGIIAIQGIAVMAVTHLPHQLLGAGRSDRAGLVEQGQLALHGLDRGRRGVAGHGARVPEGEIDVGVAVDVGGRDAAAGDGSGFAGRGCGQPRGDRRGRPAVAGPAVAAG